MAQVLRSFTGKEVLAWRGEPATRGNACLEK